MLRALCWLLEDAKLVVIFSVARHMSHAEVPRQRHLLVQELSQRLAFGWLWGSHHGQPSQVGAAGVGHPHRVAVVVLTAPDLPFPGEEMEEFLLWCIRTKHKWQ